MAPVMGRSQWVRGWAAVALAAALGVATVASAPPVKPRTVTAAGLVTGACHVSPIVDDLDRAARFYHDLIGLDLVPTPRSGATPLG